MLAHLSLCLLALVLSVVALDDGIHAFKLDRSRHHVNKRFANGTVNPEFLRRDLMQMRAKVQVGQANLKRNLEKRSMKHEDEWMEEHRKQKVKRQQAIPLVVGVSSHC